MTGITETITAASLVFTIQIGNPIYLKGMTLDNDGKYTSMQACGESIQTAPEVLLNETDAKKVINRKHGVCLPSMDESRAGATMEVIATINYRGDHSQVSDKINLPIFENVTACDESKPDILKLVPDYAKNHVILSAVCHKR